MTSDLPTLTGSEKQVAWALDLRARVIAAIEAEQAQLATSRSSDRAYDLKRAAKALRRVEAQTKAEAFIHLRGFLERSTPDMLLIEITSAGNREWRMTA